MKTILLKNKFLFVMSAAIALSGCKTTDWSKVTYTTTPNPLEMHGDTITITVKGSIPAKTQAPKEVITLTPMMKWNGGEVALKPLVFQGEKIKEGKGIVVAKKKETNFNYSERVAYRPEMRVSEFTAKAVTTKKDKVKKEYQLPKLADATIVTPLLVMSDEKPVMAKENMPRVIPMGIEGDIHFLISQDNIRPAELKADDMKALMDFIANSQTAIKDEKGRKTIGYTKNYDIKGISISAYASPDGEQDKNANLAADRGKAAAKELNAFLKKNNLMYLIEKVDTMQIENAKTGKMTQKIEKTSLEDKFYTLASTPEDWEGFKSKMEASTVPDKEMILRILSTYADLDKREAEIKNISKAYTEISDQILPALRRAKISVTGEKKCKTDEVLMQMAAATPDSLTAEELLYTASITTDMATQTAIYSNCARIYPNEWRGHNNLGCMYLMQNKINEAGAAFEKANQASANNPAVLNNMGIIAMKKGDKKAATEYYGQSSASEANYNMGRINILNGKYSSAVSNYGDINSFNAALAKLLNGNADAAMSAIEASNDKDSGMGNYLKAVISARKSDAAGVAKYLTAAIAKDASLKEMAKTDMEFVKVKENEAVKSLMN
jgi:Flp pilus assembly protein TadD